MDRIYPDIFKSPSENVNHHNKNNNSQTHDHIHILKYHHPFMSTSNAPSDSQLPSPILDISQKKSKPSSRKDSLKDFDESQSISEKDDNELLESLSKIQSVKNKNTTQSLVIDKEWHPVDFKSELFADNARSDNVNQSTQVDISMKESNRDKLNHKKPNPLDQPTIRELDDSLYLEEPSLRVSKIIRASLNRIKENKEREWIEPNFDIFDDPQLDNSPQGSKKSSNQEKDQVHINYAERKLEGNPTQNFQQTHNIPSGLGEVLMNMINASRNHQNSQQGQPNTGFLYPQPQISPPIPPRSMHASYHPSSINSLSHDGYNLMVQSHFQPQFQRSIRPKQQSPPQNSPSWTQPHTENSNSHHHSNQQQSMMNHSYSGYELMNEIKYLREDVKILRQQWREDRAEKLIQRLQSKLKTQSKEVCTERKGSDSYERDSFISFEVKNLLEEQERKHEKRMKEMEALFMGKIQQLEKEQKELKEENSIFRRKSMFKHTDSQEYSLQIPEFVQKKISHSRKKSVSKLEQHPSAKQTSKQSPKDDEFLKNKQQIIAKDSPLKNSGYKRKKTEPKSSKNTKKDKVYIN